MKTVVVCADGSVSIRDLTLPIHQSAGQIVGGPIEIVHPVRLRKPFCMIVNEVYTLMNLPVNLVGCYMYRTDVHGHPICGDIIFSKISGEDLVDLTAAEADTIYEEAKLLYKIFTEGYHVK